MTGKGMSRTKSLFLMRQIPKAHGAHGITWEETNWMEGEK
jgi:hypothetical protein